MSDAYKEKTRALRRRLKYVAKNGLAGYRQTTNAWRFRAQSSPSPKCPLVLVVGRITVPSSSQSLA